MIGWVDITNEDLRDVFEVWCELRFGGPIPHVGRYNNFIGSVPKRYSVSVKVPTAKTDISFRFVGEFGMFLFPQMQVSRKLAEITPPTARAAVATPFYRVVRSGQPYCRRADYERGSLRRQYEQLLLPFGDKSGRVRLVDAVFADLGA